MHKRSSINLNIAYYDGGFSSKRQFYINCYIATASGEFRWGEGGGPPSPFAPEKVIFYADDLFFAQQHIFGPNQSIFTIKRTNFLEKR